MIKNIILLIFILTGCEYVEVTDVKDLTDKTTDVKDLNDEATVHYIDVGQGDSTLIEVNDYHILIDAGQNYYGDDVVDYLNKIGVDDIEILVGTHPDADHIGGLDIVLEAFDVETIVDSCKTHTSITWQDYIDAINNEVKSGGVKVCDDFLEYKITDNIVFEIIETGDNYSDNNENSVVSKLTVYDTVFLFTSDAEESIEKILLDYDIDADIYKAGHHGSRTSSSSEFLEKVTPEVVVISAGLDNKYDHPHIEALNRLNQYTDKIYGTWISGDIVITANSNGYFYDDYEEVISKEQVIENIYNIPLELSTEKGIDYTLDLTLKPNTEYDIKVIYKSGESSASGLENKVTDNNGDVSWTWNISSRITSGTWEIIIDEVDSPNQWSIDFIVN